jgi:hypothetical protein
MVLESSSDQDHADDILNVPPLMHPVSPLVMIAMSFILMFHASHMV